MFEIPYWRSGIASSRESDGVVARTEEMRNFQVIRFHGVVSTTHTGHKRVDVVDAEGESAGHELPEGGAGLLDHELQDPQEFLDRPEGWLDSMYIIPYFQRVKYHKMLSSPSSQVSLGMGNSKRLPAVCCNVWDATHMLTFPLHQDIITSFPFVSSEMGTEEYSAVLGPRKSKQVQA